MAILMVSIYSLEEKPELINLLRGFLNLSLEREFISNWFFNRVVHGDPNQEPKYILFALDGKNLAASLIGVRRIKEPKELVEKHREIAWIKTLSVGKKYRSSRVFNEIITEFEESVKNEGVKKINLCDFTSWYFAPGIDVVYEYYIDMFVRNGFRKIGECINYELDLLSFRIPVRMIRTENALKDEGIIIKAAAKEDEDRVSKWVHETFWPPWDYETTLAFEGDEAGVWIAEDSDKNLLGFSVYGGLEPTWFGPIGVVETARRRGIGSILLYRCVESMRSLGKRYISIPWTSNLFFYSQLSIIKEIRHFWKMEKIIE